MGQERIAASEFSATHPDGPPRIFFAFAVFSTFCVLCSIPVSLMLAPGDDPMFHFGEGGINTALSAVCLAMASALAAVVFYLRLGDWSLRTLFWLVLAAGCLFLCLDEQLQFHERGGAALNTGGLGAPDYFRNWNDVIVIAYGLAVVGIVAVFGREILACRTFAVLFAIGFGFYVAHTAIDSTVPNTVAWKDIPEEGAKLLSVFFLFLAVCARLLALIENRLAAAPRVSTR